VIALVLRFVFGVGFPEQTSHAERLVREQFAPALLAFNVIMVVFNMLPAFPMDGGRVLRALLAMRMPYSRATRAAASVGQFMAIMFGLLGLWGNPFLLLIALFVWIGAESEAAQVEERVLLKNVPVRTSMLTEFHTVSRDDTLGHAAELLLAGAQQDFPIAADDGTLDGVLTRSDLMAGLAKGGPDASVADFSRQEIGSVEADSSLAEAVGRLRAGHGPCLQVLDRGKTVGLLTLENVAEFLMVRAALAERPQPRPTVTAR
jgi:CBS domain-containing protein